MIVNVFVFNDIGILCKIIDIVVLWYIESICILVYLFWYINVLIW